MQEGEIWHKRDELNKRATNIFANFVFPIYMVDYRQAPILYGSAFLMSVKGKKYLVTAAHSLIPEVGADFERHVPCILIGKMKAKFFIKDFAYSAFESDGSNKYDLAVAQLSDNVASQILLPKSDKQIAVATPDIIMPNLPRLPQGKSRNLFCMVGYQHSKNKSRPNGEYVKPKSTAYLGGSPDKEKYKFCRLFLHEHLLVDFPTESDREGRMPGLPNGLSGGPVFAFGAKDSWENVEYGVAGVTTGHIPTQNLLKATDIGFVNALIAKYDSDIYKGRVSIKLD